MLLVEGYAPAQTCRPHSEHKCHESLKDDDVKHWSVLLAHCGACGVHAENLLFCARCHAAAYCDKDCQRAAWGRHKGSCVERPALGM